jgi:hypothetical protein
MGKMVNSKAGRVSSSAYDWAARRRIAEVLAGLVLAQGNQEVGDRLFGGRQIYLASTRHHAEPLMLQRVLRESVRL